MRYLCPSPTIRSAYGLSSMLFLDLMPVESSGSASMMAGSRPRSSGEGAPTTEHSGEGKEMAKRGRQRDPRRGLCGLSEKIKREIKQSLKNTAEQRTVVEPLVARLVENGWSLDQIVYGKKEWRVPKSPSQATKREKGDSFVGFPVDVAIFDDPAHTGDFRHLLFMVECKQPTEDAGIAQLIGRIL